MTATQKWIERTLVLITAIMAVLVAASFSMAWRASRSVPPGEILARRRRGGRKEQ